MLDRNKMAQEIEKLGSNIFTYNDTQFKLAQKKWPEIAQNPNFKKTGHNRQKFVFTT